MDAVEHLENLRGRLNDVFDETIAKGHLTGKSHYYATCLYELDPLKWSQKTGQLAKVYPEPLKGYENGEAPEVYRPV